MAPVDTSVSAAGDMEDISRAGDLINGVAFFRFDFIYNVR